MTTAETFTSAPIAITPVGDWILAAQQRSLTHDQRIDTLSLTALRKGIAEVPVDEVITDAHVTLTIDGASTLTIDLHDPLWLIERSGILDNPNGRLASIVVNLDGLSFRLSAARRRSPETITLEFEDEAKAVLDEHSRPLHASRSQVTRGEFIAALVAEVKARDLVFIAPEAHRKQAIKRPTLPNVTGHGAAGFDQGVKLKVAGQTADEAQKREIATVMGVCDLLAVTPRVRLAAIVAAIGESNFRAVPNAQGSGYAGVFQADPKNIKASDTEKQATYFLQGGLGFQAGGAIQAALDHPDWSVGTIAYSVEGSRANFPSDSAAENHYGQWHDEAVAIAAAWNGGNAGHDSQVLRYKSYEFARGLPGKRETSWQAATRLASDVNWRFFAIGDLVCFVNDDYLLSQPASLVLDGQDDHGNWQLPDGLLSMPEYDINHGKLASEVTLRAIANRWSVVPGEVVVLRNLGQASGRWIVETFDMGLLDATTAVVTLIKPLPPRLEPATDTFTVASGASSVAQGATAAVAWAHGKIGHYREEWGHNRGQELDTLERKVGMIGAPWCAIFATTALMQGGIPKEVRTAAVADLNAWCKAGTHGLKRGYRATPEVGDLVTFGDAHVALVEKVDRGARGVTIIEGNNSQGTVGERSIVTDYPGARFIRPDWPA